MEHGINDAAADNRRYGTKNKDTQFSADGHDNQSPDCGFNRPINP